MRFTGFETKVTFFVCLGVAAGKDVAKKDVN